MAFLFLRLVQFVLTSLGAVLVQCCHCVWCALVNQEWGGSGYVPVVSLEWNVPLLQWHTLGVVLSIGGGGGGVTFDVTVRLRVQFETYPCFYGIAPCSRVCVGGGGGEGSVCVPASIIVLLN